MKILTVQIRAELEVPDNWVLAEHPSGIQVLKVGDDYVDFDLAPMTTQSNDPEAEWTDVNADIVQTVLDSVTGMDVELVLDYEQ